MGVVGFRRLVAVFAVLGLAAVLSVTVGASVGEAQQNGCTAGPNCVPPFPPPPEQGKGLSGVEICIHRASSTPG